MKTIQPKTIQLKEPIDYKGKIYNSITIQPFKAKHLKTVPSSFWELGNSESVELNSQESIKLAGDMMPLIASLANVDDELIGELSFTDLMEVISILGPFLEGCLEIGEK